MVFLSQPPDQSLISTIPTIQLQPFAQLYQPLQFTFCPIATVARFQPTSLRLLDFRKLQSFDLVQQQYQTHGIEFEDAIALQPSNPAFIDSDHPIGIMPLIDRQPLTIHFNQPLRLISLALRGVGRIRIKIYHDGLVEEQQVESARLSSIAHTIQLNAIDKVEIQSNTPFLLHHLIYQSMYQ